MTFVSGMLLTCEEDVDMMASVNCPVESSVDKSAPNSIQSSSNVFILRVRQIHCIGAVTTSCFRGVIAQEAPCDRVINFFLHPIF